MIEDETKDEQIRELVERWQNWLRLRTEKCKNREVLLNTQDEAIKLMGEDFLNFKTK